MIKISCPFCNSKNLINIEEDKYQFNSYSFILAKYKNCTEKELIRNAQPIFCRSCTLSFYQNWISDHDNEVLYTKLVPHHPSCENISKRDIHYESDYLKKRLHLLSSKEISDEIRGRFTREVNSLLTSIGINPISVSFISNRNINQILNEFDKKTSRSNWKNSLIPGTKYSGFQHSFIENKINDYNQHYRRSTISNSSKFNFEYTEIGCPTWGLLESKNIKIEKLCFCNDVAENFWEKHSEFSNSSTDKSSINYIKSPWNQIEYSNIITAFACIDHTENLLNFLKKLLTKTKCLMGTFEETEIGKSPPIQHHYSLNYLSLHACLESLSINNKLSTNENIYDKYTFFIIEL